MTCTQNCYSDEKVRVRNFGRANKNPRLWALIEAAQLCIACALADTRERT